MPLVMLFKEAHHKNSLLQHHRPMEIGRIVATTYFVEISSCQVHCRLFHNILHISILGDLKTNWILDLISNFYICIICKPYGTHVLLHIFSYQKLALRMPRTKLIKPQYHPCCILYSLQFSIMFHTVMGF